MNKDYVKILVLVPIVLYAIMFMSFLIAGVLEFPTDRGALYLFFCMLSFIIFFLTPVPCLIMSIIGIVSVSKIRNSTDERKSTLFALGIIDIFLSIIIFGLAIFVIISGQSI